MGRLFCVTLLPLLYSLKMHFFPVVERDCTQILNEIGQLHNIGLGTLIALKMKDERYRRNYEEIANEFIDAYHSNNFEVLGQFGLELTKNAHIVLSDEMHQRLNNTPAAHTKRALAK